MWKRNVFGQIIFFKKLLIAIFGWATHPTFNWVHQVSIKGTNHLKKLPRKEVLIVSNHQTYFAEVTLMYHIISATHAGFKNRINNPVYLFNPRADIYYVAADETMNSGIMPRIFSFAGAVTVTRTWREAGKEIDRAVNTGDTDNIGLALSDGWVITFPQGTTTPFKKGRKGTAHIIKNYKPVVVPVRVDGFRRAFDKKGMRVKKERRDLSLTVYKPLEIDYGAPVETILEQVMEAIGQSEDDLDDMDDMDGSGMNSDGEDWQTW